MLKYLIAAGTCGITAGAHCRFKMTGYSDAACSSLTFTSAAIPTVA